MTNRRLAALAAGVFAFTLAAPAFAGSQDYAVSGFDQVSASAGVRVILKQGEFAVHAQGPSDHMDELRIEKRGSQLIVSRKSNWGLFGFGSRRQFTVTVSAPSYREVNVSSGADLEGAFRASDLRVTVSSGADVRLSGECAALSANVSSGGNLDGRDMACRSGRLNASSGGDMQANVSERAEASASSGGAISVRGNPQTFESNTSSGGSVRRG